MPRSWARIVLTFATTLAAWLVVMPARAAAPLCDDRCMSDDPVVEDERSASRFKLEIDGHVAELVYGRKGEHLYVLPREDQGRTLVTMIQMPGR